MVESVRIERYGRVGDTPGVRELDGSALVKNEGPCPFVLRGTDAGPGERDKMPIAVGDQAVEGGDSGFTYGAEGPLLAGDLVGTWTVPEMPEPNPSTG